MNLVLNVHLRPTGKPEIINPEIALYFTDKPQSKFPMLDPKYNTTLRPTMSRRNRNPLEKSAMMGRTNAPGYSSLTLFFAAHSAAGEISTGKYFRRICRRAIIVSRGACFSSTCSGSTIGAMQTRKRWYT